MPRELTDSQLEGKGSTLGTATIPQLEKLADAVELELEADADVNPDVEVEEELDAANVVTKQPAAQVPDVEAEALATLESLFVAGAQLDQQRVTEPQLQQQGDTAIEITDDEFEKIQSDKGAFVAFLNKVRASDRVDILKRVLPAVQADMQQQMSAQQISGEFYRMFPTLRSKGREVGAEINKIRMLNPEMTMPKVLIATAKNLGAVSNVATQSTVVKKTPVRVTSARQPASISPESLKASQIRRVTFNKR